MINNIDKDDEDKDNPFDCPIDPLF